MNSITQDIYDDGTIKLAHFFEKIFYFYKN